MENKYSRKLSNKLKALNIHLRPFKYKFIKFIRNIIFFRRILKCKKFSESIALNPQEISILERLETKGYSFLPKTFFSKDEIEDLYSYLEKTMRKKENNINNILDYKNTRAINRGEIYKSDHILYKLMTNSKIIKIISKYLGMHPQFRRADIVISRNKISTLKGSQLWHTDLMDNRVVKLFIYLTDVLTDDYGPFILSEKDHKDSKSFLRKSNLGHFNDQRLEEMNIKLKPLSILGNKSTAFIVDTALTPHKGSIKMKDDRLVFVATYTTHSHWMDFESNIIFNY